jgi:hypothetical protein
MKFENGVRRTVQFSGRVVRSGKEGRLMRAAIRRLRSISRGAIVQPVASGNVLQVLAAQKADTRYRPMPFDGKVSLLKVESAPAINRGRFGKGRFYGWERLALGGVEVIPIPGDHNSCLRHKDHVPVVALRMSNLLAALDLSVQAAGVSRA